MIEDRPRGDRAALRGSLMIVAAASLWGTWSLFLRTASRAQPIAPAVEGFYVSAVVFAVAAPFAIVGRERRRRDLRAWLLLGGLGVANAFNMLMFFGAMQKTSIAIAVLTHYLSPLIVAFAAPLFVGERMSRGTWLAMVLTLVGLGLLLEPWRATSGGIGVGALLGAGSAFFHAILILGTKRLGEWFRPMEILAWHNVPILITLSLFVPAGGMVVEPTSAAILAAGGLLPGALAGVLFVRGMRLAQASRAAVLVLLEPLVAVVIAAAVWCEVPSVVGVAGAALILAGAYRVLRGD